MSKKCVICGKEINGYGNSALPIVDDICCDECNNYVIVPSRLYLMQKNGTLAKEQARNLILQMNSPATVGAKVLIIEMDGEPNYSGKSGVVQHIDDLGQLHGTWGGCAIIPTQDTYVIIGGTQDGKTKKSR